MFHISKSYIFVATAILMAVASYIIAWWNIQNIKAEAQKEVVVHKVTDPMSDLLQKTQQLKDMPKSVPMNQAEVSGTMQAVNVASMPKLEDLNTWQKNSRKKPLQDGKYYIAIVIDDVGVVADRSRRSIEELPREVTLAFLPYGESTKELSKQAYDRGHEVMIHLPMQAKEGQNGYKADPGANALYTEYDLDKVRKLASANIDMLKDISVGVNNHMGSKFTEWQEGMAEVFNIVNNSQLMFLDSLTTPNSTAGKVGESFASVPLLKRDVFLDHVIEEDKIMQALEKTVSIAKANGSAIAIGHPHEETIRVLKKWVNTLEDKNIQLVPITALIKEK